MLFDNFSGNANVIKWVHVKITSKLRPHCVDIAELCEMERKSRDMSVIRITKKEVFHFFLFARKLPFHLTLA